MEGRKTSKTTRSYGKAPRSSRNPPNPLPSQSSAPCPQYKERVRSAPLGVPQLEERQQQQAVYQTCEDNVGWGNQTSEPVPRSPDLFITPVSSDSSVLLQPYGNDVHVKIPQSCFTVDDLTNQMRRSETSRKLSLRYWVPQARESRPSCVVH